MNLDKRFNECMSFLSLGLKILPYKRRGKTNKKGRGKQIKKEWVGETSISLVTDDTSFKFCFDSWQSETE